MFECYDVTNKWLFFVGMPILMVCSEHPTLTALHCSKVLFLQCCHIKRYNKIFTKNWGVHSLLWDTQGLICGSGSGTSFCRIPLLMRQWKTFLLTCSVHIWKILYNDCVCGTATFEIKNLSARCELLCSHNIMHGSNSLYRVFFLNCSHLLEKKPGYSPGRSFLCNCVCIWPLKFSNKLRKITPNDTRRRLWMWL